MGETQDIFYILKQTKCQLIEILLEKKSYVL